MRRFPVNVSVAVFASGGGSNFQSLLDRQGEGNPCEIRLLLTNRKAAGALERARKAGVASRVIPVKGRPLEVVGAETLEVLGDYQIEVILLAGYLQLIPSAVVRAFSGRILNVHPALLPAFGGKGMWGHHVHEAVLASGATFSGPSIHFVDEEYDTGRIFAQWPVPVLPDDTPDTLGARVLRAEHVLYPLAAAHLCEAVAQGREPARFSPPGEAFQFSGDFSPEEVSRQIQTAFGKHP
jgi:formyltetrahydrofolate-dependent phosphoribosylglycinamide formyltransferase